MKTKLRLLKSVGLFILMMPVMLIFGLTGLREVTERLAAKGKIISQIYDEAGENLDFDKVKCLEGDTSAKLDALKVIDIEVTELREQRVTLLDAEKALKAGRELNEEMNQPADAMKHPDRGIPQAVVKSMGELFMESKAFQDGRIVKNFEAKLDIDLKTTMTAGSWDPIAVREARVELFPLAPISVVEHIPMLTTQRDTIRYMRETTFTNTAAEKLENTDYIEATLALQEQTDEVERLGVFLPVTDEQLEDVAGMAGYINQRLTYMIRARLDSQILVGDGSTPNLLGTLLLGGLNDQPLSTDSRPDAFYKAMTQVRVAGFAEPSVVFVHPNDWQVIRLLTTADGIYIFGSPMDAGQDRIWGVPVVKTTAMTENTALVGDYRNFSALYTRRGVTLKITDSHASLFIRTVQVIRADMRIAMVHYRIDAFCKITSI